MEKKDTFRLCWLLLAMCLILSACKSSHQETVPSENQTQGKTPETELSSQGSTELPSEMQGIREKYPGASDYIMLSALEVIREKYPNSVCYIMPVQAPEEERYRIALDVTSSDSVMAHKEFAELLGEKRYLVEWTDNSTPAVPLVPWLTKIEKQYHINNIFTYELDDIGEAILAADAPMPVVHVNNSEEEIRDLIDQEIMRYMEGHPVLRKTDKSLVEEGDSLEIAFKISDGSRVYYDVSHVPVKCGKVVLDEEIDASVAGHCVGESYTIPYTGSGSIALAFDDEQRPPLTCEIRVLYIYEVEEAVLDDSYVKENTEYATVQEWRDSIRESIGQQNYQMAWEEVRKQLWSATEFKIDSEKLVERASALAFVVKFQASQLGISEQAYIRALRGSGQETTEDYITWVYNQCKSELEEILLIRAIAGRLSLSVTEAELMEACQKDNRSLSNLSKAEKNELEYYLLFNKVLDYFIQEH